ncbi:MAG: isopentenyl phosphate kinase family protein [Thermoplasmata archaeon]|nr:isopentenyl phosphate kinase family protein [Thermoplasmata archaeon]
MSVTDAARPNVVKLGGSVLTRKREERRLRPKVLARLAREVEVGRGETPLVLLHGAGSFGHIGARKYGLAGPPTSPEDRGRRVRGAVRVAAMVRELHQHVLETLVAEGVPAWSIPPSPVARNRDGGLEELGVRPFQEALRRNLVPVSFGDVVEDAGWGFSILSADTLAVRLASELTARRVIFVSDVPGVLERAIGSPGRPKIVPRLDRSTLDHLLPGAGAPDVTGGIRGKVSALLAIADGGVDAGIISGLQHGALSRSLRGEHVYGSWGGPSFS